MPDQKIDLALNEATGAALAKDAADASSALSDRTVAQQMAATGTTTTSAASPVALGSPAAPKQTGNSPRPETRAALYCMLELGPKDCQEMFAAGGVRDWALNFWIRPNAKGDFERGPLKSVVYVGQSSGIVGGGMMDVYRVTFAHLVWTISIQQPESDGKIHHVDTSNPWVDPPANAAANSVSATPLDGQQAHNENLALNTVEAPATAPASAGSGAVSPMAALSNDGCQPVIGTLTSVHSDPGIFATDIVLGDTLPSSVAEPLMHAKKFTALIPTGNVKDFPALDAYVGQKVAIWPSVTKVYGSSLYRDGISIQITRPLQLQSLSTALADPKKTWCYISPAQRTRILADRLAAAGPSPLAVSSPAPATGIRPEIEQSLDRAEDLFKREDAAAAMQMVLAVEAVPDLNPDEKHRLAIVGSFITPYFAFNHSGIEDNTILRGGTDFPFRPPVIITPN